MATQVWPLLGLNSAESASDTGLRVDVYDSSGKLNAGPVTKVLACTYSLALGQIGSFTMRVPAEDDRSSILVEGNEVRIFRGGEGLVFRGLIEHSEITIDERGEAGLDVSGPSHARQLVWEVEDPGSSLNALPVSVAVTRLLAGTGWTAGAIDAASTTVTTPLDGASRWAALNAVADVFGMHLRENNRDKTIDIGAFGTNPQNLVFQNIDAESPALQTNPRFVPIQRLRIIGESSDVVNSIVPRGQSTGITGEQWTLEHATRTTPYTIQTRTGMDGKTVRYLEDATSVATYGRRKRVMQFRMKQPLGLTATDFANGANALYDEAATWLTRHKDKQAAYEVTVVGLRHYYNGQPMIRVGDVVKVIFNGIAEDVNGRRAWKTVNANLYVMGFTRGMGADESDVWRLVVSTVPREVPTDGNVTAEMLSKLQAVEAAPLPFVLFGDNQMRIDKGGIQIISPSSSYAPGLSFVREFVAAGAPIDVLDTNPNAGVRATLVETGNDGFILQLKAEQDDNHFAVVEPFAYNDLAGINLSLRDAGVDVVRIVIDSGGFMRFLDGYLDLFGERLRLGGDTSDPASLADGDVWYRSDTDKLYARINGVNVDIGGAGMSLIVKAPDETVNNSAALQDDDDLLFAVAANESWQFEGTFFWTGNGTADLKLTFAGPAGSAGAWAVEQDPLDATAEADGDELGTTGLLSGTSGRRKVHFWGAIANGANAGSLKLQWAQNTADASDTTIHAGSYIKYQRET